MTNTSTKDSQIQDCVKSEVLNASKIAAKLVYDRLLRDNFSGIPIAALEYQFGCFYLHRSIMILRTCKVQESILNVVAFYCADAIANHQDAKIESILSQIDTMMDIGRVAKSLDSLILFLVGVPCQRIIDAFQLENDPVAVSSTNEPSLLLSCFIGADAAVTPGFHQRIEGIGEKEKWYAQGFTDGSTAEQHQPIYHSSSKYNPKSTAAQIFAWGIVIFGALLVVWAIIYAASKP